MRSQPHHHNREVGLYEPMTFPASTLANVLGSPPDDAYRLRDDLYSLCRICVKRFGMPHETQARLSEALGVPDNQHLRYPPLGGAIDLRWNQLAKAVDLPKNGNFLPIAWVRLTSETVLEETKKGVSDLINELKVMKLRPLDPHIAHALEEKFEGLGRYCTNLDGENHSVALAAYRQARIFRDVGVEWTLASQAERDFLTQFIENNTLTRNTLSPSPALARSNFPASSEYRGAPPAPTPSSEIRPSAINRKDQNQMPPARLLAPFGLQWHWREVREPWEKTNRPAWEPAFEHSRFTHSTLFDHAPAYFEKALAGRTAQRWGAPLRELAQALSEAHKGFLLERYKHPLHENQLKQQLLAKKSSILNHYLDRLSS